MRVMKQNADPVDIESQETEDEDWEEEFAEIPHATFKANLLRLRKKVSAKLFSIEFEKITF